MGTHVGGCIITVSKCVNDPEYTATDTGAPQLRLTDVQHCNDIL